MTGEVPSGAAAAKDIPEAEPGTPAVTQCTEGCPCLAFPRYNDPFSADYRITNCAGLSARLRDIWGDLDPRGNGSGIGQGGFRITITFSVRGLQRDARAAGALIDRGADISSDAPDSACDILFVLWPLISGQWGAKYVDAAGATVFREDAIPSNDFHIVAGRIDKDGKMPAEVYSTNGARPLEGPAPIDHWAFTRDIPYFTSPDNAPQFARADGFTDLPDTILPFQTADMPANSVDDRTGLPVEPGQEYFRVVLYNDMPITEAFIVKADFMRGFTTSA